jgi:hypothetical protein
MSLTRTIFEIRNNNTLYNGSYERISMLERLVKRQSIFDEPIQAVLADMRKHGPDHEDYPAMLDNLAKLNKMKTEEKQAKASRKVSWDTIAMIAGNVVVVTLVIVYEQRHVWTTKSMGLLRWRN